MDSITFGWHYFIPHDIIEIAEVVDRAWLKEIFMLFMSLRCRILAKLTERENEQDKEGHALLSTPTKHRHILRPTIYLYLIRGSHAWLNLILLHTWRSPTIPLVVFHLTICLCEWLVVSVIYLIGYPNWAFFFFINRNIDGPLKVFSMNP